MKICIVSDFFIPHYNGGGERRYYEIAKRMVVMGHSVDLICMKIQGVNSTETIDGINIYHLGPTIRKPPYRNLFNFIHFIIAAFWWMIKHDYDVIDAQTYAPLIPGFLAAKIKGIKVIGTIHDVSSAGTDQWLIFPGLAMLLEKILVKLPFNKIITVSYSTRNALIENYGVNPKRIQVVHNGVDLELIDSVKVDEKYKNSIIYVGRLAPHKHVDDLISALKSLRNQIPTIKLKIVGNGIEKENLAKMVTTLGLDNNVEFLGELDYKDVILEIKKSNVLVLPSTREGFGMVLAEAGACKVPVIAYRTGGVVEIVEDGKNGFLVESRDIGGMAEKIQFFISNNDITNQMGLYGYKKVENFFKWNRIVKTLIKIYRD
ncbi:MAG: glycosyltransferase family 4 protein [Methanobacteriaceae archaeon]|nr:glycosyltransferase family 4 protein [Methanobacteriaceae archaeon]